MKFPPAIKNLIFHITRFLKKSDRDNVNAMAAQSAFFLILSVIPFMLFAFSVFTMLTGLNVNNIKLSEMDTEVFPAFYYK